MASILKDCVIVLSGTFVGHRQDALGRMIKKHGGTYSTKVTDACTHLITTPEANGVKNKQAASVNGINIVSLDWLLASDKSNKREDETQYSISSPLSNTQSTAPDSSAGTRRSARQKDSQTNGDTKRALDADSDTDANAGKAAKKADGPATKKRKNIGGKASQKVDQKVDNKSEPEDQDDDDDNSDTKSDVGDSKPRALKVPVDEHCPVGSSHDVYIDGDEVIYDAALNQTNSGRNNNKFYIIQLLQSKTSPTQFCVWNHWGRVGETGQTKMTDMTNLESAMSMFVKKFKDKACLPWAKRNDPPKPGKYTYIERNYEEDSEDEADSKKKKGKKTGEGEEVVKPAECTLPEPVQELISLIFNQQLWQATMSNMSYDAKKLPLGKLSKRTLRRGYEILKELSEIINNPTTATSRYTSSLREATVELSDQYFTVIPHAFGRSRPPTLDGPAVIKREVDLLETLTDMEIANEIMNTKPTDGDSVHELDRHFSGLNLNEMTSLDHASTEFQELEQYLVKSHGQTHYMKYKLKHIFRIDRQGEKERYEQSPYANIPNSDRRLLWHGSRATNYGGILSQGLRIAPPEAPSTGYMFGKGVYFADISSKSANYCCSNISNNVGILLLCDVEVGDPMLELINSNYNAGEDAKKQDKLATLGIGRTIPPGWKDAECLKSDLDGVKMPDFSNPPTANSNQTAYLQYNEYIVYDVAQIRQKYLFYVQMT